MPARNLRGVVADGVDVVAVGIADERPVVVGMVKAMGVRYGETRKTDRPDRIERRGDRDVAACSLR